jgi:ethanolamine utilization protein EutN
VILGRVVGEVWSSTKHAALDGRKLLIIEPYLWYAPSHEVAHLVAVDAVGAGVGEDVVVCMGDPARRSLGTTSMPVEAAVCAIVDRVELSTDRGKRPLTFVGGREPAHDSIEGAS